MQSLCISAPSPTQSDYSKLYLLPSNPCSISRKFCRSCNLGTIWISTQSNQEHLRRTLADFNNDALTMQPKKAQIEIYNTTHTSERFMCVRIPYTALSRNGILCSSSCSFSIPLNPYKPRPILSIKPSAPSPLERWYIGWADNDHNRS